MPEFLKNQRKTDVGDLKKNKSSTVYFLHLRLNAYVTYFVQIHLTEWHFWGDFRDCTDVSCCVWFKKSISASTGIFLLLKTAHSVSL